MRDEADKQSECDQQDAGEETDAAHASRPQCSGGFGLERQRITCIRPKTRFVSS
jgi:hypothetical protein